MTIQTVFCKHYRAISEHKTCAAGVAYESLKGIPFESRPCFCRNAGSPPGGCDLAVFPTAEELANEEADLEKRFACIGKARAAMSPVLVDRGSVEWLTRTARSIVRFATARNRFDFQGLDTTGTFTRLARPTIAFRGWNNDREPRKLRWK